MILGRVEQSYAIAIMALAFLYLGQSHNLRAQNPLDSLNFQHIKTGMSHSSVSEIFQDSQGYLWIGTPNGLNKYNGSDFQIFDKSLDGAVGLTNGYVERIYEDEEGIIYIGTYKGLNWYDRNLDIVKPYDFKPQGKEIQNEYINVIHRTGAYLLLGTTQNGLYRYSIATGETKRLAFETPEMGKPDENHIIEIFELLDGRFFLVTQASSHVIDINLQVKHSFKTPEFIRSAFRFGPLQFFMGTRDGKLLNYELVGNELALVAEKNVSPGYAIMDMEEDVQGNLWLATENAGLAIYSIYDDNISTIKANHQKPSSISNNSIWSLRRTKDGVMWMGLFKKGLSFYDPDYDKFEHVAVDPFNTNSLSNNIVNCFSEDEFGNMWIGTDGGGLNYWDRKENEFEHFNLDNGKLNSNVVLSLLPVDEEELWIGSWAKGISIFNTETKDYEIWNTQNSFLASNNVMGLIKDSKNRIWIATLYGGLQVYDLKTKKYQDIPIRSAIDGKDVGTIARLFQDDKGAIWVGTQTMGVFKLMETSSGWSTKQYHTLNERTGIRSDFINSITQDDYGNLWVGTQAGLHKYIASTDRFEVKTKADGLVNDAIKGIVQDEYGLLWLSTNKGIIKYNDNTGEMLNYDIFDGLQGNEFNASSFYKTNTYEIVFGGNNGFNIFTSTQAEKGNDVPEVVLSGLKIFNKPVYANDDFGVLKRDIGQVDSITLSHEHSVFNIDFHALTLKAAKKVEYAYFLEGFEKDWNYVGNKTSATYTNIDPGDYKLRVKSSNADGVWNDEETTLFIKITPPFWATWWFRSLVVLGIVGAVFLYYYNKIKKIRHYQAKLERRIDERTKELLLSQKKLMKTADELSTKNDEIQRFTYAVSHDLKSPLSGIKGIASLIPLEMVMDDFPDMEKYLEMINVSCDTMATLIADITKIAKIGKIENRNELLEGKQILEDSSVLVRGKLEVRKIKLDIPKILPQIYGDRNRIIQVFGNLLDNAIKYMGDQKHPMIKIKVLDEGDFAKFQVIDNGSGMDAKSLKKLFSPFERFHADVQGTGLGLYMVKQIVVSHGGEIVADSEGKGKGTTFSVTLPKTARAMQTFTELEGMVQENEPHTAQS